MRVESSYHHGNLRAALLAEASSVLEAAGADAISLRGLARAMGVSHAAPAHHFASRTHLLGELAADGFVGLADALQSAMGAVERSRWLEVSAKAYVRFALANPERYRLMFGARLMEGDCPERLATESTRAYRALLRAVRQQDATEDRARYRMAEPELAAWSLVHGAVMLWLDGQLAAVDGEAEFLDLIDAVVADHPAQTRRRSSADAC